MTAPDPQDDFTPIMTDNMLIELDSRIKTLDPAAAEVLRQQVLEAAKSANNAQVFLSMVFRLIGGAIALF